MSAQGDDLAPAYGARTQFPSQTRELFPVQMGVRDTSGGVLNPDGSLALAAVPEPSDEELAAIEAGEPAEIPIDAPEDDADAEAEMAAAAAPSAEGNEHRGPSKE